MPDRPVERTGTADGSVSLAWSGPSDKRSYYRLFAGYVIALFATGIAVVALALLAFDLQGEDSGTMIGTALSIKMAAYVLAAPVAAALTERLPRKQLLVGLDLLRAASLALLPFVWAAWHVYVLVFVFALSSATFTLVYMTLAPYLLRSEGDYALSLTRARIAAELDGAISPMLAAGLLLTVAVSGIFVISALGFILSAALVARADLPRHTTQRKEPFWRKALRGIRLFASVPAFRAVIALDVVMAAATAMVMVNSVVIVQGLFDLDAEAAALAFFVFGAGSVMGALVLSRLLPHVPDRAVMLAGAMMIAAGLILGALVRNQAGLLALWAGLGLGVALALTPVSYLIRRTALPSDLQTLFAAQLSISNICLLAAYALAGWAGAELGIPAAFLLFGLIATAGTLAAHRLWRQSA